MRHDRYAGSLRAARAVAPALVALAAASVQAQAADEREVATVSLVAQARAHEHGEGVAKDALKAAALYCEAARSGDAEALFSLGWMYANGRGVAHDDSIAAGLLAQAAQAGHAEARKALAFIRADEPGLPSCMREQPAPVAVIDVDLDAGWGIAPEPEVDPLADLTPQKMRIAELVARVAARHAVDPKLALAVIAAESNFDPQARSHKDARGLMQLIPETAARFNVRNVFDIAENLRGGLTYLRWLLAYYQGNVAYALAAYNAGEKAVDRYRGIPPYPETRDYVKRIQRAFRREHHPYDAKLVEPSPIVRPSARGEGR